MLKRLQGFIIGVIVCSLAAGGVAFAANRTLEATFNNIKIVVDGKEFIPMDANGNSIEPFIVNGTTYLPVRAVAGAVGKEVYWDGPNYTVYLGNMDGKLEYPSLRLKDVKAIGGGAAGYPTAINDQYGNRYGEAYRLYYFETLLDMKYTHFKATVVFPEGTPNQDCGSFKMELDGRTIYTSPKMNGIDRAFDIDVVVTGGNHFILDMRDLSQSIYLADAGFYQ